MNDIWSRLIALAGQIDIDSLTLTQLAEKLGLKHRCQAKHYKEKAESNGLLVRNHEGKLIPVSTNDNATMIVLPVMGYANCGPADRLAMNEVFGTVSVSPSLMKRKLKKGAFAVRAVGESMNTSNINGKRLEDGDFAVVEPTAWHNAAEGDYVVSIIDNVANIKKLKIDRLHERVVLKSESSEYFDDIIIAASDLYAYRVAGVVVDVVKSVEYES